MKSSVSLDCPVSAAFFLCSFVLFVSLVAGCLPTFDSASVLKGSFCRRFSRLGLAQSGGTPAVDRPTSDQTREK